MRGGPSLLDDCHDVTGGGEEEEVKNAIEPKTNEFGAQTRNKQKLTTGMSQEPYHIISNKICVFSLQM